MGKLFGTDGVRGVAGEYPLDADTVFRLGAELGNFLRHGDRVSRVVIGRDTRASGAWLEQMIIDGLAASGVEADVAEIFTTPGISFLVRSGGYQAGVVVSASHNPYRDNGVKIFGENGMKMSDAVEEQLEHNIFQSSAKPQLRSGTQYLERLLVVKEEFMRPYVGFLRQAAGETRQKYRIVVDSANGAAFRAGPDLLRSLGHEVIDIHNQPDGTNINLECGALHPDEMCRTVVRHQAHFGVAFDGDADRSIFSDGSGQVVDGDHILYIFARHLKERGELRGDRVVATVMSNVGLEVALRKYGIALERTQVGDRYVLEKMVGLRLNLGGEQSGHILLLDRSVAGDGILTTVELMNVLSESGRTLGELTSELKKFPQILVNVSVGRKPDLSKFPAVRDRIDAAKTRLGDEGRVLVRYSGTEPIARVMVEGRQENMIRDIAREIAQAIQDEIG
ncbi:MAG TPA: phosphoglucosamine mutase [Acidobacteriota bacterium]|jgi:phosphoglucosamine mutase